MRFDTRLHTMKIILPLFFCAMLINPFKLFAQQENKILLLNSNSNIEKYAVVEREFINSIAQPVVKVDLEERSSNENELRQLISEADLIYCIGGKAYSVAVRHGKNKKIVFSSIINWMRIPMTSETYGISNELHTRMTILMFRSIFPDIKRVGVLYSHDYTSQWFNEAEQQAGELEIKIIGRAISNSRRTIAALNQLLTQVDALWLIPDPIVMSETRAVLDILEHSDKRKKPVFSYLDAFAAYGASLIVSVDEPTIGRQAAGMALDILTGALLTENIQFPAGSSITLNMGKIEAYNLKYNEDALRMVNNILK